LPGSAPKPHRAAPMAALGCRWEPRGVTWV
jgi:hypothetical protein